MVNAVFIQNKNSIYDDRPGVAYHFPRRYLNTIKETVGDWVIFYEGKQGALGYTSVQRVDHIAPDPSSDDHYYAMLDRGTLWQFERVVQRNDEFGIAWEHSLRSSKDGAAISGGASVSAVRRLTSDEFTRIVLAGLEANKGPLALPREVSAEPKLLAMEESQAPFGAAKLSDFREKVLTARSVRDASFARQVKAAYRGKCAMSGLDLRNGGGRAEVQAAHIRPVKSEGPDTVNNGIALSGTLHWMFDRGLLSIGENFEILVSENKVDPKVRTRLLNANGLVTLPKDPRDHPHPEYIRFHRENVFGQVA